MRIVFELPGLPKTINAIGRAHWAVKAKAAREWKKLVAISTASARKNLTTPATKAEQIGRAHV